MLKILFVCAGNICRSPVAAAIFQNLLKENSLDDQVEVDSAGTLNNPYPSPPSELMVLIAWQKGVKLEGKSRQIKKEDLEKFDLIVAMDRYNQEHVFKLDEEKKFYDKIVLMRNFDPQMNSLDVPDPYGLSQKDYDDVFAILERSSGILLKYFRQKFRI